MAIAAPKSTADINIDLLKSPESTNKGGEVVHWLLNVGRYLIIITQIIALAIFILSIKLATDKNNLSDDIQRLTTQVAAEETFENEFRNTSKRFSEVKRLKLDHFENNKVVAEFLDLLPKGMVITSFSIGGEQLDGDHLDGDQMEFSGEFENTKQLQTLVVSFSKSNKIVGLDIQELNHPNQDNDNFTFTARSIVNQIDFD